MPCAWVGSFIKTVLSKESVQHVPVCGAKLLWWLQATNDAQLWRMQSRKSAIRWVDPEAIRKTI